MESIATFSRKNTLFKSTFVFEGLLSVETESAINLRNVMNTPPQAGMLYHTFSVSKWIHNIDSFCFDHAFATCTHEPNSHYQSLEQFYNCCKLSCAVE